MKPKTIISSLTVLMLVLFSVVCIYPVRADSDAPIAFHDSAVVVYSPVNMTYNGNVLFLNLSIGSAGYLGGLDSQISMNYSIDGLYNGPVPLRSDGEIHITTRAIATLTLPKLTDGPHTLTLYLYGFNQRVAEPRYLWYTNTVYFSTTGNPSTPAPTATPTPSIPELPPLAIVPLLLSVFALAILLRPKKQVN